MEVELKWFSVVSIVNQVLWLLSIWLCRSFTISLSNLFLSALVRANKMCAVCCVCDTRLAFAIAVFQPTHPSLSRSLSSCTDSVSLTSIRSFFSTCCLIFFIYFFCCAFISLQMIKCLLSDAVFLFLFFFFFSIVILFILNNHFELAYVEWQQLNDIIQCFVIIKNRLVLKSEMLIYTITCRPVRTFQSPIMAT